MTARRTLTLVVLSVACAAAPALYLRAAPQQKRAAEYPRYRVGQAPARTPDASDAAPAGRARIDDLFPEVSGWQRLDQTQPSTSSTAMPAPMTRMPEAQTPVARTPVTLTKPPVATARRASFLAPVAQQVEEPPAGGSTSTAPPSPVEAPSESVDSNGAEATAADEMPPQQTVHPPRVHYASPFAPHVGYDPSVPHEEGCGFCEHFEHFLDVLEGPIKPMAKCFENCLGVDHNVPPTNLNGRPIGLQPIPCRPKLVLECNEDFLGRGFLKQGICLPTGAVWRPALWMFGTYRGAVQTFSNGTRARVTENANRLDLFTQLNLSGTERVVLGLRPFDEQVGERRRTPARRRFSGWDFETGEEIDGLNADIQTLFFEGDFGELFPNLDPWDTRALDYGFSVGRQPLLAQQGLLINEDAIDAVTVTRNTLYGHGNLNLRTTLVYAWDHVTRTNQVPVASLPGSDSQMLALLTESDFFRSTVNADVAYVWTDDGVDDLLTFGISGIQRIHGHHNTYNSSLHFLASFPTNDETPAAGQGELLFHQFSWTPHKTDDLVYVNTFWAIDEFTSPARGPLMGGPLGQTGLLFAAAGLGRYLPAMSNQAHDVVGASLGYQMFFDHYKQQMVVELGGRQDTDGNGRAAIAAGAQYQKALDQHWIFILGGFVNKLEGADVQPSGRVEMLMKF